MQATTSGSITHKRESRWRSEWAAPTGLVFLCLALSAAAVVPFYFMGEQPPGASPATLRMPVTHDMFLHFDQMKSFYNGLAAGEIYPRWEEDTNRGFGAPTTSYYPPGVYYLTSTFYLISHDWMRTLLAVHLLMMIASAGAIYLYARSLMSRAAAAVAMTAYILLPYHLIDQYQRGAVAELLGFVWMPLIMLFSERLFKSARRGDGLDRLRKGIGTEGGAKLARIATGISGLAASYGGFLWSHPPTAYQFTPALILFLMALTLVERDWKGLVLAVSAMGLALALSAAYLYPAAREQELIRHEYVSENWPYHRSYVFARTEYAQAHRDFFDRIDHIWVFCAVAIIVCGTALLAARVSASAPTRKLKSRVALWALIGGLAGFMTTSASQPLGSRVPRIDIGVFSWRMLSITTLVVALLAGACAQVAIESFREQRTVKLVSFGILALATVGAAATFSAVRVVEPMATVEAFQPEHEHFNFAIIPRTAPEIPEDLPEVERAELAEENGRVEIEYWKPEHRALHLQLNAPDQLWVRTFNFPGWTAFLDGHQVNIETGELGDIVVEVPAGNHRVSLDYLDTPARKMGNRISAVSLCVLVALVIVQAAIRVRHK